MPRQKRTHVRQRLLWLYAVPLLIGAGVLSWFCPNGRWEIVEMLAIALVAGWGVGWYASRTLHRQIHELRENADAIARGELGDSSLQQPRPDFPKLVDSLGKMTAQLRKMLDEQDRLRRQLSRSEKLAVIGELAATVAHEVNNPLDGLQSSVRLLRRNIPMGEQNKPLLELMENGLLRIETIVQRLLAMSRDEPLHLQDVSLEQVVDDAVMFVHPRLNEKSIKLVRDFPFPSPRAMADRVQLSQAMINLMLNAADAMDHGGVLTMRAGRSEGGDSLRLEIIDTGIGIPPEQLPCIFESFYTTKERGVGTGLGLPVVKRIIEAHQGTIHVQSQVGQGTCFRLELPIARETPLTHDEPAGKKKGLADDDVVFPKQLPVSQPRASGAFDLGQ